METAKLAIAQELFFPFIWWRLPPIIRNHVAMYLTWDMSVNQKLYVE